MRDMTAPCDSYLGVPLERWKNDIVCHLRDERRRNAKLQQALDDANAVIAKMQAEALDRELPLPKRVDAVEQLRRRSKAVRRLLGERIGMAG